MGYKWNLAKIQIINNYNLRGPYPNNDIPKIQLSISRTFYFTHSNRKISNLNPQPIYSNELLCARLNIDSNRCTPLYNIISKCSIIHFVSELNPVREFHSLHTIINISGSTMPFLVIPSPSCQTGNHRYNWMHYVAHVKLCGSDNSRYN